MGRIQLVCSWDEISEMYPEMPRTTYPIRVLSRPPSVTDTAAKESTFGTEYENRRTTLGRIHHNRLPRYPQVRQFVLRRWSLRGALFRKPGSPLAVPGKRPTGTIFWSYSRYISAIGISRCGD